MPFSAFCTHNLTLHQVYDRNDVHVRIFVCEFITGGGLYRESLPPSLALEGDLMLQALLGELLDIPRVEVCTTRDYRMPALPMPLEVTEVSLEMDVWQCWSEHMHDADAVWLVAPESEGILERLSEMVIAAGAVLIGSSPPAVAMATRKSTTSEVLARAGVNVVPTWQPSSGLSGHGGPWVAKPDDGAGCEDTCLFGNTDDLNVWLGQHGRMQSHVVQPFLTGEPASISMLCRDGKAWVLSCNRQNVALHEDRFSYHGSVLNGMASHWDALALLAGQVASAVPGLAGYVGVDVMISGREITVLEINPRLTTSFVGLRQATGLNTAGLVLDLFYNENFEFPQAMTRNVVEISLDESKRLLF